MHDRLELEKLQKDTEAVAGIDAQSEDSLFRDIDNNLPPKHSQNRQSDKKRGTSDMDRMAKTGTMFN